MTPSRGVVNKRKRLRMLNAKCLGGDMFFAGPLLDGCVCDMCGEALLLRLGLCYAMLDGGDIMRKSARNVHKGVFT